MFNVWLIVDCELSYYTIVYREKNKKEELIDI